MYQPTHFVQTDAQAIAALLRAHPLATLVHHDPQGGLVADAIPMLWQPDATGAGGTLSIGDRTYTTTAELVDGVTKVAIGAHLELRRGASPRPLARGAGHPVAASPAAAADDAA